MNKEDLLKIYTQSSFIKNLSNQLDSTSNINGFSGSQIAFIAAALYNLNNCNYFFIFQNKESALIFKNDFEIISKENALLFTTNNEKINSAKEITAGTHKTYEYVHVYTNRYCIFEETIMGFTFFFYIYNLV